jgi:predicted SAM-dependent methyltransferase
MASTSQFASTLESQVDDFYTAGVKKVHQRVGIRRLVLDAIPKPLLKQIDFELHMLLVRLRARKAARAYLGKTDLLVNVGAGDEGRNGWINVDGYQAKGITLCCDARKYLPFPDKSVKGIFSEHFFEHLDYTEEAPGFLAEAHRVLKEGGVLRLIVPDAERYLKAYVQGDWQDFAAIRPLDAEFKDPHAGVRYNTKMELINMVFRQAQEHKFAYDFETLSLLLQRNGFQDVTKQEFGKCLDPEICLDLEVRAPESLYVDAVKRSISF